MSKYENTYFDEMYEDVLNAIEEEKNYKLGIRESIDNFSELLELYEVEDKDELIEKLNDNLWLNDSVTGNASGSYYFNNYESMQKVLDSSNHELLLEMVLEFGIESKEVGKHFLNRDFEWFDVSIRCYLLSQVVCEVVDNLEEKLNGGVDNEN